MYFLGRHCYEWTKEIDKHPKNSAKALIDFFGELTVVICVRALMPEAIKGKEKIIKEIEFQLIDRPNRSWNNGVVK